MTQLPLSRLIATSVNLAPAGAQMQNTSNLLILTNDTHIDVVTRMVQYADMVAVALDFASNTPAYLAAQAWFAQVPQPTSVLIGRWAKTASAGQLFGGPVDAANQLMSYWNAITTGSFKITVDGGAQQSVVGLNFSAAANMNAVAAIIQAGIAGATVVWDAAEKIFIFTSNTTGAASTVSFLAAGASGVDISGVLKGLSTSAGAYVANGIVPETALAAATAFDDRFGQQFYGLVIPEGATADHQAVAAYIEAATNKHVYGVGSSDANILSSGSTTDIAYLLKASGYKRSVVQYSSTNIYSICSLMGRIIPTNYNGNNTVITLMYKQEPGVIAESLTATQIGILEGKNCNVFVAYNNNTAIVEPGVMSSGEFFDVIAGTDWLALAIQTAVYNLLSTSPTKIPQTDAGNNLIMSTIEGVCAQAVTNGLLAPGVWTSGGFGSLNQNDFLPKGYYVYAPSIGTQSAADRAARRSVAFQVAAKLAGAIHTVNVTINVNR